ncbi:putative nucleic acid-binding protein [Granulicella arctica]|uniref:Putative nucleic acid-binding protein n=2 Tax=Granulicella arctica TaxID=940613 RepID=A0A7Y9PEX2_9BACT|nr:putative nucleic acid-binding protein [Granulicella arctica]
MLRFANVEDDRSKVVSALAQIEARSAICRLRQGRFISPDEAVMALETLAGEIRRILEQPVNPPVLDAASALIDRHDLRALDAVQLGSAIVSRELLAATDMRFIASDKALLEAARKEGFDVWDPGDE